MSRSLNLVPRAAFFLAGAAVAAFAFPLRDRLTGMDSAQTEDLKRSLASLETRLDARMQAREASDSARQASDSARLTAIEAQLGEHATRLADVPSTGQIVAAMEQLLSKTMASLDDRLSAQARSIDVLKTTVSQTDSLLERVLESLDSLQSFSDPADLAENPLLTRPAI
jgi:chromosome segregation ATPase